MIKIDEIKNIATHDIKLMVKNLLYHIALDAEVQVLRKNYQNKNERYRAATHTNKLLIEEVRRLRAATLASQFSNMSSATSGQYSAMNSSESGSSLFDNGVNGRNKQSPSVISSILSTASSISSQPNNPLERRSKTIISFEEAEKAMIEKEIQKLTSEKNASLAENNNITAGSEEKLKLRLNELPSAFENDND